jgi:hypothetical protein
MIVTFARLKKEAAEMGRDDKVLGFGDVMRWGRELSKNGNAWRSTTAFRNDNGEAFVDPGLILSELKQLFADIPTYYPYGVEANDLVVRFWQIQPLAGFNDEVTQLFLEWVYAYFEVER